MTTTLRVAALLCCCGFALTPAHAQTAATVPHYSEKPGELERHRGRPMWAGAPACLPAPGPLSPHNNLNRTRLVPRPFRRRRGPVAGVFLGIVMGFGD